VLWAGGIFHSSKMKVTLTLCLLLGAAQGFRIDRNFEGKYRRVDATSYVNRETGELYEPENAGRVITLAPILRFRPIRVISRFLFSRPVARSSVGGMVVSSKASLRHPVNTSHQIVFW
jgi:hypothetical protein